MINKSGYNQIMPGDSFNTGDMFARYKLSGVEVPLQRKYVYTEGLLDEFRFSF